MTVISRRDALHVAASFGVLGASRKGSEGARMQAVDFERARVSWITKEGVNGNWRVIATACRRGSADCIHLAPVVMAGKIFGTGRLPLEPPYSYQLIAMRDRHAIVRQDEAAGNRDSEADNEEIFSFFEIHAPRHPARLVDIESLDSRTVSRLWPMSVRLSVPDQRGELWDLEFPVGHISTRIGSASAFQVESGPILIPGDITHIADASVIGGCYLAYVFLNKRSQIDLLAWGPSGQLHRNFVRFNRIGDVQTDILSQQPERR